MSSDRPYSGSGPLNHGKGLATLFVAMLCAGCASPGPPRPPSLNLPALVTDLSAERVGDHVVLRWTTPSRTTDDLPVKGPMTAQICRETGARPATPVGRLTACIPVVRLAVAPGTSEVADPLPRALNADAVGLITYRIQISNAAGRSAGDSRVAALAASGIAPPPLEGFSARASEEGAILEWRRPQADNSSYLVDIKQVDLTSVASEKGKGAGIPMNPRQKGKNLRAPVKNPSRGNETHLRTKDEVVSSDGLQAGELSGTVVPTAKLGETYTYAAQRVRLVTVGGHQLEIRSLPSPAVTLIMRDTFPPQRPVGLATVPSLAQDGPRVNAPPVKGYIDLSWAPDTEADLAGYIVYRQLARPNGDPEGPLQRLTAKPVSAPAYRDVAVTPGQRYIYSVTAVDASGNESAPSAQAQEVISSAN